MTRLHTSRMSLAEDVDLEEYVTAKDDLSGADIKAVCTEAGLLALRERRMRVTKADFTEAREKVRENNTTRSAKSKNILMSLCHFIRFSIERMKVHQKDCIFNCSVLYSFFFYRILTFSSFIPIRYSWRSPSISILTRLQDEFVLPRKVHVAFFHSSPTSPAWNWTFL